MKRGDRIAQLILERIAIADVTEVAELGDTDRGAGGFGSTGVAAAAATPAAEGSADAGAGHGSATGEKKARLG